MAKAKRGRPCKILNPVNVNIRMGSAEFGKVQEIAALESAAQKQVISAHELIRRAVDFVYGDNERMRECFRRAKRVSAKHWMQKFY